MVEGASCHKQTQVAQNTDEYATRVPDLVHLNCHQVFTGAVNPGDHCYAVGHLCTDAFIVYGSGTNLVILSSQFETLQIIPGSKYGNIQVGSVECSSSEGMIAASYAHHIYLFKPRRLEGKSEDNCQNYRWHEIGFFQLEAFVSNLSWNPDGSQLVTAAAEKIQLWTQTDSNAAGWFCSWQYRSPNPVVFVKFSPSGTYFATAGKDECLVKIWYRQVYQKSDENARAHPTAIYNYVYVSHPGSVTGFSWRAASSLMPKNSVLSYLMTSCSDNICRIWAETSDSVRSQNISVMLQATSSKNDQQTDETPGNVTKSDDKVDMAYGNPNRFHLVSVVNPYADIPSSCGVVPSPGGSVPSEAKFVVHWLNNKQFYFNLQAEIIRYQFRKSFIRNAGSDTPVCNKQSSAYTTPVPETSDEENEYSELDNSRVQTPEVPKIEVTENHTQNSSTHSLESSSVVSASSLIQRRLPHWIREWKQSPDMVFCIHPIDGSLLIWKVHSLDQTSEQPYKHPQITFACRIPSAFPASDAISCSTNLLMYRCPMSNDIEKLLKLKYDQQMTAHFVINNHNLAAGLFAPNVIVLSKHGDGSLNQWEVSFDANSKYSSLQTISHLYRVSGHRFQIAELANHPTLPLVLTTSHHNVPKMKITENTASAAAHSRRKKMQPQMSIMESSLEQPLIEEGGILTEDLTAPHGLCSELILWRVDPVGPLSHTGGLLELARVQSPRITAFSNVSWLPVLLPSSTLGPVSKSPSVCFIAFDGIALRLYQAVIDAHALLMQLTMQRSSPGFSSNINVVSQQSTKQPACIIELDDVPNSNTIRNSDVKLFHVFRYEELDRCSRVDEEEKSPSDSVLNEKFVLVVIVGQQSGACTVNMWNISMTLGQPLPATVVDASDGGEFTPSKGKFGKILHPVQNLLHIDCVFAGSQVIDLSGASIVSASVASRGPLGSLGSDNASDVDGTYQIVTATSDGHLRFWTSRVKSAQSDQRQFRQLLWQSWSPTFAADPRSGLDLTLNHTPVSVTCADFGKVAVAYKLPPRAPTDTNTDEICIKIEIFENESTGGAHWVLEDSISTGNICPPKYEVGASIHELVSGTSRSSQKAQAISEESESSNSHKPRQTFGRISSFYKKTGRRLPDVPEKDPSPDQKPETGIQKVYLDMQPHEEQKEFVHMSWVPKCDGSYLLCLCTGKRIILYSISKSSDCPTPTGGKRSILMSKFSNETIVRKWRAVSVVDICTSDELSPFPVLMAFVSNGVLIVGLMNEMQIFTQWQSKRKAEEAAAAGEKAEILLDFSRVSGKSMLEHVRKGPASIQSAAGSLRGSVTSLASSSLKLNEPEKQVSVESEHAAAAVVTSVRDFIDPGIFEDCRAQCPVLPQYHPHQLTGLLNFGKICRVKAILSHLLRSLVGEEVVLRAILHGDLEESSNNAPLRSRTLSRSYTVTAADQALTDRNHHIDSIAPLPLHTLVSLDDQHQQQTLTAKDLVNSTGRKRGDTMTDGYDSLLGDDPDSGFNLSLDIDVHEPKSPNLESLAAQVGITYFGPAQYRLLAQCLAKTQLPELSRVDQMHLMAIAEVVSSLNTGSTGTFQAQGSDQDKQTDTIDECGMRFVMGLKLHQCMTRSLPPSAPAVKRGLDPRLFAWAHISESEDQMLAAVKAGCWTDVRLAGVGWWVTNINALRQLAEKLARSQFMAKKEPMDAALFYMAMRKKNVLKGLFKSIGDTRMTNFFSKDFSTADNKKAAMRNAFALNSKQRFEHAAAFFLLADSLEDAVQVCMKKLGDVQLAMVIARLYEEELEFAPTAKAILRDHVIGAPSAYSTSSLTSVGSGGGGGASVEGAGESSPFLKCIAHWWLKEYSHALLALIAPSSYKDNHDISVFNFYNYLRRHPMIIRRHLLKIEQMKSGVLASQSVLISAMTGVRDSHTDTTVSLNEVTVKERLLFFKTAAAHFANGCPLLALEVLNILPPVRTDGLDLNDTLDQEHLSRRTADTLLNTGNLSDVPNGVHNGGKPKEAKAAHMDWGQPPPPPSQPDPFDWGAPPAAAAADSIDWAAPAASLHLDINLDMDDILKIDGEEEEPENEPEVEEDKVEPATEEAVVERNSEDVYARYLKQAACLKVFVEELRTLAMSLDIEESQLRAYFRIWLERVVELLHSICQYKSDSVVLSGDCLSPGGASASFDFDLQSKLAKAAVRKQWLKQNELLLRLLLNYSSIYGSNGGGLTSISMELILLLQELQQDNTRKQLMSPLPFPTTLPLISACLAPIQTVVSNPLGFLQKLTKDIIRTIVSYSTPPQATSSLKVALTLRNLCASLSSCVFQSLQDSDKVAACEPEVMKKYSNPYQPAPSELASMRRVLTGSRRARSDTDNTAAHPHIISDPANWPGVKLFCRLLQESNLGDESVLKTFLVETVCAVYIGILFHALVTHNANELLRVVAHPPTAADMFPRVAGGCVRAVDTRNPGPAVHPQRTLASSSSAADKHRVNLNMKLLQYAGGRPPMERTPPVAGEEQSYRHEKFCSPTISLIEYFLSKPNLPSSMSFVSYDSDDEEDLESSASYDGYDSDDDYRAHDNLRAGNAAADLEHTDTNSYSWCLMRFVVLTFIMDSVNQFLLDMGLELAELALVSPQLQTLRKTLSQWHNVAYTQLELFSGPPQDYIPTPLSTGAARPRSEDIFHASSTPFRSNSRSVGPVKRLWCYLVRKSQLQNIFFHYCFPKPLLMTPVPVTATQSYGASDDFEGSAVSSAVADMQARAETEEKNPVLVLHRDPDRVSAVCFNHVSLAVQTSMNCMVVSSPKEVTELDISSIVSPSMPSSSARPQDSSPSRSSYGAAAEQGAEKIANMLGIASPAAFGYQQQPLRRTFATNVRKLESHPFLPFYLSGCSYGKVNLWEWNHKEVVAMYKTNNSKVTGLHFNAYGNKFGVCDESGGLSLYNTSFGGSSQNLQMPYMSLDTGMRECAGFAFGGSSSLLATAGILTLPAGSTQNCISFWDSLLPARQSRNSVFSYVHNPGSSNFGSAADGFSSIEYNSPKQMVVAGTMRGDVLLFDVRQRRLAATLPAFSQSHARSLALDPLGQILATGSRDGDIKVFDLNTCEVLFSVQGEHKRRDAIFKTGSRGVLDLRILSTYHLLSCGSDGTVKLRKLASFSNI